MEKRDDGLSVRVRNALLRRGYNVRDLERLSDAQVLAVRGLGEKALREIREQREPYRGE